MVDKPICEVGVTHHLFQGPEVTHGKNVAKKDTVFVEHNNMTALQKFYLALKLIE